MSKKPVSCGSSSTNHSTIPCKISTVPRKFLVHFRRPLKSGYDGSYGFDWLRDEYVYDIERVKEVGNLPKRLYKGNVSKLIKEYTRLKPHQSVLTEVKQIKTTNGEVYVPAWIGIFPTTKGVSNPHPLASSLVNVDGVDLHLQIDQEAVDDKTPLTNDGTILQFKSSSGIVVSPSSIPLGDLLKKGIKTKTLNSSDSVISSKNLKYYKDETVKINIKATGVSSKAGYVKIIAEHNGKKRNVGVLMVYPNNSIPKADVMIIDFCTTTGQKNIAKPRQYELYLKSRSFNQALVRGEVVNGGWLNIIDKKNDLTKSIIKHVSASSRFSFLPDIQKINTFLSKYPPGVVVPTAKSQDLKKDIVDLYENFSNYFASSNIDDNDNKKTVVIFSDYNVYDEKKDASGNVISTERTLGSAMRGNRTIMEELEHLFCDSCHKFKWGNVVVLFNIGNTQLDTFAHELGHSFSLLHTFDDNSDHIFYRGFTDNLMDYVNQKDTTNRNQYEGHMWALFKWQWDILRNDRSINYKES